MDQLLTHNQAVSPGSQNEYDYDGDLQVLTASGADVGQNSGFNFGQEGSGFSSQFGNLGTFACIECCFVCFECIFLSA